MISKEEREKWKVEAEAWMEKASPYMVDQTFAVRIVALVEEIARLQERLDDIGDEMRVREERREMGND